MSEKSHAFEENFNKLEKLSRELQENRVSIDELVPRMKEALGSIKVCKDVLKETQSQLHEISKEFKELDTIETSQNVTGDIDLSADKEEEEDIPF